MYLYFSDWVMTGHRAIIQSRSKGSSRTLCQQEFSAVGSQNMTLANVAARSR